MLTMTSWKTNQMFLMVSPGALDLHLDTIWMVHLNQENHVVRHAPSSHKALVSYLTSQFTITPSA